MNKTNRVNGVVGVGSIRLYASDGVIMRLSKVYGNVSSEESSTTLLVHTYRATPRRSQLMVDEVVATATNTVARRSVA